MADITLRSDNETVRVDFGSDPQKHVHQTDYFAINGELHVILNNKEGKYLNWNWAPH